MGVALGLELSVCVRIQVDPVVDNQFVGLADQVTRHHIEEM